MPNSVLQFTIRSVLVGQPRDNVQYWTVDGHTEQAHYFTAKDFVDKWITQIKNKWVACLPPDCMLEALIARVVGPESGPHAIGDVPSPGYSGSRGSFAISDSLCPCVTLIPPMGTKSAGRTYMPAVDVSDYSMNAPAAGYVTVINTLFNACIAGFATSGGVAKLAIFSRKTNLVSNVSAFHLSPLVGYQRKRARPAGI